MQRRCICGKQIKPRWALCPDCLKLYGPDRSKWPDWVKSSVKSIQKELNQERRHLELSLDDENFQEGVSGARKVRTFTYDPDEGWDESNPYGVVTNPDDIEIVYPGGGYSEPIRSIYDDDSLAELSPEEQSAAIWAMGDNEGFFNLPSLDPMSEIDMRLDVLQIIRGLPGRGPRVIYMLMEGYTQAEIAEDLGITQPAVSQIKSKFKSLLIKYLSE